MPSAKGSPIISCHRPSRNSGSNPLPTMSANRRSYEARGEQEQQFGVDRRALGPLALDEGGHVGERNAVDPDILVADAAALAGPFQPVGAKQSEAFGGHPRRRMEASKRDHARGPIAGLL